MAGEDQHLPEHQQRQDHDQLRLAFGMLVRQLLGCGMQFEVKHTHTQHREYYDKDDCGEQLVTAVSSAKKTAESAVPPGECRQSWA